MPVPTRNIHFDCALCCVQQLQLKLESRGMFRLNPCLRFGLEKPLNPGMPEAPYHSCSVTLRYTPCKRLPDSNLPPESFAKIGPLTSFVTYFFDSATTFPLWRERDLCMLERQRMFWLSSDLRFLLSSNVRLCEPIEVHSGGGRQKSTDADFGPTLATEKLRTKRSMGRLDEIASDATSSRIGRASQLFVARQTRLHGVEFCAYRPERVAADQEMLRRLRHVHQSEDRRRSPVRIA
jgi:hypothetical protein